LSRRFGSFVAVDAVSFAVQRGEVFGFLGPNGAGKTTTIKMLTGFCCRRAGAPGCRLRLGDRIRVHQAPSRLHVAAFLALRRSDGRENIAFFCGLYGVPRPRRRERRDWVLDHRRALRAAGSSRRQPAARLEAALGARLRRAARAALLFLDEPTSGVDPLSRRRFWDLIASLAAGGTTVFVSTTTWKKPKLAAGWRS
jgi:ABC-2 type transport system ATP-binding protein